MRHYAHILVDDETMSEDRTIGCLVGDGHSNYVPLGNGLDGFCQLL